MKIKKAVWVMIVAVILGAGAVIYFKAAPKTASSQSKAVYYCPMHPTYTSDRPGNCPICNMKLVLREGIFDKTALTVSAQKKAKAIYSCPMHPDQKSDKPGPCPICHMDMVKEKSGKGSKDVCFMHSCPMAHDGKPCPMIVVAQSGEQVTCPVCGTHVAEEESSKSEMNISSDHAEILISPQKMQLMGVKTVQAGKKSLVKTIRTVGRVAVDETKVVHVHPKVEGWVEEVYAKYEGDVVKKGQPVFSFYSPDFVSAQEEYLLASRALKNLSPQASPEIHSSTEANVNSAKKRLLWWDISEDQIVELEKRGTAEKSLILNSPIDGVVLAKHVFAGEYMERGADFYELADLSMLWVEADIYEYDLSWVKVGQEAAIHLSSDEQKKFTGKVVYLSPTLKAQTRTATARIELANPENVLKPEMFVNAQIAVDLGQRLVVPSQSVMDTGVRKIVFVSKGEGLFEPREVIAGVQGDEMFEIKEGVEEGESVVTNGNFLIDSESRLKAAVSGMVPPPSVPPGADPTKSDSPTGPTGGGGMVPPPSVPPGADPTKSDSPTGPTGGGGMGGGGHQHGK